MKRFKRYFLKDIKIFSTISSLFLVLLTGYIDYVTGYEFGSFRKKAKNLWSSLSMICAIR
ncbi:MAG: hypothetical protein KJ893_08725 [Candidatus Omnitrophica bacterium]|nr:hypothetical protein [Candidatus Omnitrophota bacterium]MCG2703217.1 hypothetical protein [Candidatus Omnitrophota bacterium]